MDLPQKIVKVSSSIMDQEFIPSEIIINILSRLPVKTVIHCKCVCKSWLKLLETPEFAKDHLSKSSPGLIVYRGGALRIAKENIFKVFEFVNDLELEHHGLHYNLVTEFEITTFTSTPSLGGAMCIEGSANGLVLLRSIGTIYVCNPITREYIELPGVHRYRNTNSVKNGFGVSMKSGQYKVVSILMEFVYEGSKLVRISRSECWVYTLGTGAWRSIASCPLYCFRGGASQAFLNGNLHWSTKDLNDGFYYITCFDLETELFSTFSPPSRLGRPAFLPSYPLAFEIPSCPLVFEDCLCICDDSIESGNELIVIWVMKEYGNENSWTKQFVFPKHPRFARDLIQFMYPLKLFEDDVILLLWGALFLCDYSKKTNTAEKLDLFEFRESECVQAWLHVSSFLSLKSLAMETVRKF